MTMQDPQVITGVQGFLERGGSMALLAVVLIFLGWVGWRLGGKGLQTLKVFLIGTDGNEGAGGVLGSMNAIKTSLDGLRREMAEANQKQLNETSNMTRAVTTSAAQTGSWGEPGWLKEKLAEQRQAIAELKAAVEKRP